MTSVLERLSLRDIEENLKLRGKFREEVLEEEMKQI